MIIDFDTGKPIKPQKDRRNATFAIDKAIQEFIEVRTKDGDHMNLIKEQINLITEGNINYYLEHKKD